MLSPFLATTQVVKYFRVPLFDEIFSAADDGTAIAVIVPVDEPDPVADALAEVPADFVTHPFTAAEYVTADLEAEALTLYGTPPLPVVIDPLLPDVSELEVMETPPPVNAGFADGTVTPINNFPESGLTVPDALAVLLCVGMVPVIVTVPAVPLVIYPALTLGVTDLLVENVEWL